MREAWHLLFRYYGIDWLNAAAGLTSTWLVGSRKRSGFILGCTACAAGITFDVIAHSPPLIVLNAGGFCLQLRGFLRWKKEDGTHSRGNCSKTPL